jgi:predicted MPP superfamily phosphohydrolase
MKKGADPKFSDRMISGSVRWIYELFPVGGLCSHLAPKIRVTRAEIRSAKIERPIKIVQLTDLHYEPKAGISLRNIDTVVSLALAQDPDLFLLTEDYIIHKCRKPDELARALKPLSQARPAFGIFGNHDGGRWASRCHGYPNLDVISRVLNDAGIKALYNSNVLTTPRDNAVRVVGLSDLWAGDFNPESAFAATCPKDEFTILLSHNPDTLQYLSDYPWDLMLSGHTHGGQVVLPGIGAPWTPVTNMRHRRGFFNLGDRYLNVATGTGGLFQLRFNCPPEITVFVPLL